MLWAVTASVIVAHWWLVYTRALNIPENDDLQDVLFFLLELTDADSITATLGAFFAQHADHMTAASRILYWALWKCEGQINFHHLALIAPLGILLWTWLLYLQFHNNPNRNIAVLLACLCLLNPRAYTLLTWPMAAIEFYFSFFYAFAVFCCLEKQSRGFFLLALVAAALATFSFAPGIFSWPVGLLFLLYSRYQGQAVSYLKIGVWVATATTVLVAFSLLFEPGSGSSATMLRFLIEQPLYALQFYLAIAGSVFSYGNTGVAVGVGALLVAAALILLLRGFSSKLGALHFFMLYCLCALGLLTIGRAHASTVSVFVEPLLLELSLTPRYSFVSMMLLASK